MPHIISERIARVTAFPRGKNCADADTRCNRVSFDRDSVMDEYENETLFCMQNATTKNSAREKWLLARERTRGIRNGHWIALSNGRSISRDETDTLHTRLMHERV